MEKREDLRDFERGMVSETPDLLGFSPQPSGFTEDGPEKRKYPVSSSSVGPDVLLMPEIRGEWTDWLELIERQLELK